MASSERSDLGIFHAVITAVAVVVVVAIALSVESAAVAVALGLLALFVLHVLHLRRVLDAQRREWESIRELLREVRDERRFRAAPQTSSRGSADASLGMGDATRGERDATETLRETLWRGGEPAPGTASRPPPGRGAGPETGEGGAGPAPGEGGSGGPSTGTAEEPVVIPRQFALGTVALIRKKMEPEEIARVLEEQRAQPGEFFGELAVELGYLDESELEALLHAQRRGLFRDAEIREARSRLKEYRARTRGDDD